ncbi:MAG TPA: 3-hydroxyacyl-CoA dehydrogenase NAD-binding domain-containing protein, partial [Cryomorphaceae bacterium]|nr:3-hydroxyacyl-CoA dehydrogenase NAD-binding domain-containing protein [Cryomorphaceae bacterium]
MSKRKIEKVAVLGSGVMGSRIACHFANIGVEVLLLDIVPRELNDKEKAAGMDMQHPKVRNRIVNDSLTAALKSNPSPIYHKSFANRIETGNFDDDMAKIADVDWIIEVVVERLDIKQKVFENVEKHRKPGTLISTNTSGIPIALMTEGRSDDFNKHFCGTHFFNPPRYLRLLEIIPSPHTDPEVIDFLMEYGSRFLGKETVGCKDTPAFIANRVGVYSIMELFHLVKEMELSVEEVDKLTGPVIGHAKSATFRTADVVGLDTLVHVANGVKDNCKDDERNDVFAIPDYVQKMVDNNWLGSKSGQGFYKKVKDDSGKSEILSLNLETMEYASTKKVSFPTLEMTKGIDNLEKRFPTLYSGMDKAGEFYRKSFQGLFAYVSHRIPEISDELYKIDAALRAGFGWKLGPFEKWDAIGVEKVLEDMKKADIPVSSWVTEMVESGAKSFYKLEGGRKSFYDIESKTYKPVPTLEGQIFTDHITGDAVLWKNAGTTIKDLGDGILNIEFHTKMNTIGGEVIAGLNKAIDMAEADYKGLVVSNTGDNFSAGANVGMIFMMAAEQEYDELEFAVKSFQNAM